MLTDKFLLKVGLKKVFLIYIFFMRPEVVLKIILFFKQINI